MRAFHAEKSPLKRDETAGRQIHALRQFQGKNERPIKLHQVKEMFEETRTKLELAVTRYATAHDLNLLVARRDALISRVLGATPRIPLWPF
jgi:hypothetical protein